MKTWCGGFWALAVVGIMGVTAHADQLRGVVQSIDAETRKVVVKEAGTDRAVDVTIPPGVPMVTNQGVALGLGDLHAGDGLGIGHQGGVASQVQVSQAPLVGTVGSTDPDKKFIVLTPTGSDKEIRVATGDATTFATPDGKALMLKDLKQGDGVSVVYVGPKVTRVVVNVKLPELIGYVKSVAADLRSFVVTEVSTKTDTTVAVDAKT